MNALIILVSHISYYVSPNLRFGCISRFVRGLTSCWPSHHN
ncbi:hypothetical protein HMPREF1619_01039 [Klebsiella pneumoniae 909957]|nr:hypothetical protein HMPREF1619_01039 [Klebsiella pneumoniae 909957]